MDVFSSVLGVRNTYCVNSAPIRVHKGMN